MSENKTLFILPLEVVLSYNSTMKSLRSVLLVLVGIGCVAVSAIAQNTKTKTAPFRPTTAISGKVLYEQYCAACHGADAKGSGPAASALKQAPSDLTRISRQNNGTFPEDHFRKMMDGQESTLAHGSAAMPVWGSNFRKTTTNPNMAQDRIYSLMNYIESLQEK